MHHFQDTSNSTGSFHSQQTSQTPLKTRGQPHRKKYKLASCMWCFSPKSDSEDASSAFTCLKPLGHHTLIIVLCSHCCLGRALLLQPKVTVFVIPRRWRQTWAAWRTPGEQECFGMRGLQKRTPLPSLQESQNRFTQISSFIRCGKWSLTWVETKSHRRQWWINEATFLHELIAKTILWNHKQH